MTPSRDIPVFAYKLLIVLATVIWGLSFVVMKDAVDVMEPAWLIGVRFLITAALLTAVLWRHVRPALTRRQLACGGILGLLLFLAYWTQTIGLAFTTPGKNAFFTAVYCVIVPFLYWAVDRKRPSRWNVLAALLSVTGIGLVSWDGGLSLALGDVLTLIAGFFLACHIIAVAKFSGGRDIFLLTILQFAMVALMCWVGTAFTRGVPVNGLPSYAWWVLLYLAIGSTAVALLFQNVGQKYTEPASAALLLSLEAPFGVMFSVLFGAERPTPLMYLGFCVIFTAMVCSETQFKFLRKRSAEPL